MRSSTDAALLVLLALAPAAVSARPAAASALQDAGADAMTRGRALLQAGDWDGAAALFESITRSEPDNAQAWYLFGYALQSRGDLEAAAEIDAKAAGFAAVRANASYNAACAHARLGHEDEALDWLARALDAGFANLQALSTDPDLAGLRALPRFEKLLGRDAPLEFVEPVPVLLELRAQGAGDRFGWIGRNAGDTDGDGVADLLLSAPFRAIGGANAGSVYLYSGKTGKLRFQIDGRPGELLGIGIESAGDVNGDGVPDLVAGASGAGGTGAAYVYSGVDGAKLLELRGEGQGDQFGRKVAGAGDQDGDGHGDVIVGAPRCDAAGTDAGRAYVYSGASGKLLWMLDGEAPGELFGSCVDGHAGADAHLLIVGVSDAGADKRGCVRVFRTESGAPVAAFTLDGGDGDTELGKMFVSAVGDVDGDGVVDVYASDWQSNAGGVQGAGRIYVASGKDGHRLHTFAGTHPGEGFGIGTAEAGDVDGDGCDDLLVGAWQNAEGAAGAGKCTLYSGKSGAVLATYTCKTRGETFGYDTTGLGDVNGDGVPDFLITDAGSFVVGPQSGRVVIVAGPPRAR